MRESRGIHADAHVATGHPMAPELHEFSEREGWMHPLAARHPFARGHCLAITGLQSASGCAVNVRKELAMGKHQSTRWPVASRRDILIGTAGIAAAAVAIQATGLAARAQSVVPLSPNRSQGDTP